MAQERLSQQAVAERIGVSQRVVSKWLSGFLPKESTRRLMEAKFNLPINCLDNGQALPPERSGFIILKTKSVIGDLKKRHEIETSNAEEVAFAGYVATEPHRPPLTKADFAALDDMMHDHPEIYKTVIGLIRSTKKVTAGLKAAEAHKPFGNSPKKAPTLTPPQKNYDPMEAGKFVRRHRQQAG